VYVTRIEVEQQSENSLGGYINLMKGKLSLMWRAAIALVMVLSLSLVMAVPAAAATAVSSVTVVPTSLLAAATTTYTITMTTATNLVADVDTISIIFPTGITPSATAAAASDVTIGGTALDSTAKYVVSGQRVQLEVPEAVSAGTFDVVIGVSTTLVTNPVAGSYQLTVYTSKDTTAVLSTAFIIGGSADSQLTVASVALSPYTVGVASQYTITLTTQGTTLAANVDTITITFPAGTTVPASISSAAYVTIGGTALDNASDYVGNATTRVVTLTVPADNAAGSIPVVFLVGAGIINPTTVSTPTLTAHTSQEPIESAAVSYASALVAGAITKLGFSVNPVQVTPNLPSTIFTVQAQDTYSNLVTSTAIVRPYTTSGTGRFYSNAACTAEITTVTLSGGSGSFYYKDTTAGSYTVTVAENSASTPPWTAASTPLAVIVRVALYHGGTLVANFNTIQAAVTAAVAGDTIVAGAGTYTENISVTKANLTLESTAGMGTTIIIGSMTLSAGADDFVLGGDTGKGFTLKNGATYLIKLAGPDDVEISYNTFDTTDITGTTTSDAIRTEDATLTSGLTVTENTFIIGDQYDQGVRGHTSGPAAGLTVTNNTFTGADKTHEASAIEINYLNITELDSIISGNTFTAMGFGVAIGRDTGGGLVTDSDAGTLTISSNNFDAGVYGVLLIDASGTGASYDQNVVIEQNAFSSNTYGIAVDYGLYLATTDNLDPEDFTVKYNDFTGNTYAVYNNADSTADMTAEYNYWGSATGPTITTNPYGTGNAISTKVDYSPWLHKSNTYVVADNGDYPALRVELSVGWNTLSTPAKLIDTADAIDELVPSGSSVAYHYNDAWILVTTGYVLNPCDAVYIKMTSAKSVLFQIDGAATYVPSKDLAAGWNLIGQANLTSTETIEAAVASVSGSYGQVVSPSINASAWVYTPVGTSQNLVLGEGYWIFMTSAATLGGFTLCPITPNY